MKAQLVDPNGQITRVKLLVAPEQGAATMAPGAGGHWPPLPGAVPVDLSVDKSVARGKVQVSLGKTGAVTIVGF